ncbi:beta-N-acetylhexosaminidase [Robbsia andropogonis]|uniref:beta-N-acetylhexosaminidase n=1 Tax=Robbsia andropogonis TaxID=28092 RepID=UPI003D1E122B
MIDVPGLVLDEHDARRIAHPLTGGVILFARNYQNRAQLSLLTHQIRSLRPDILIAVDQEGGRVQRFKTEGFTPLPSMARLGARWDEDVLDAIEDATSVGFVLGSELRASGIDLSFTPVLDLHYGASKVIGDRAFHHDPRVVTLLSRALTHGLSLAGMANCGKHFPGHGFVAADTHLHAAIDDRPLAEIMTADLLPYLRSGATLYAVMAAHVLYPQVDPSLPACFSRIWLQRILRREMGFHGAVFSDDLSMEGARVAGDVVRGAQMALDAGCDMVLVCNDPERADLVLNNLHRSATRASMRRIKRLQARGKPVIWSKLLRQPEYLAAKAKVACLTGLHTGQ